MEKKTNILTDHQIRTLIYREWLAYIGSAEKLQAIYPDHWAVMYQYVKQSVQLPIPSWIETKYWLEIDFDKFVGLVPDSEVDSALGENPLGIVLETGGNDVKKVICWARTCFKTWMSSFGVQSRTIQACLGILDKDIKLEETHSVDLRADLSKVR